MGEHGLLEDDMRKGDGLSCFDELIVELMEEVVGVITVDRALFGALLEAGLLIVEAEEEGEGEMDS